MATEDSSSGEKAGESKYLIDPDSLFRNKKLRETSLADLAIQGLEPYIEDLPEKKRIFALGNSVTKGGKYSGSIRGAGNLSTKGLTVTNKLASAGNATIGDLIVVKSSSTLAGNVVLRSNAIFAGKTQMAGNVIVKENVISSTSLTLAGTVTIKKQLIADGDIHLKGTIKVDQIQSLSSVYARGKLFVNRDIKAERFQVYRLEGKIEGEVFAKTVGIGHNRQLKRYLRNYNRETNFANPVELFKYVGRLIVSPFLTQKSTEPFEIAGDVIADEIFLENVVIHGDLNARRITIGDNVKILGTVEYSDELNILTDAEYKTVQIGEAELLYLDPKEILGLTKGEENNSSSE